MINNRFINHENWPGGVSQPRVASSIAAAAARWRSFSLPHRFGTTSRSGRGVGGGGRWARVIVRS